LLVNIIKNKIINSRKSSSQIAEPGSYSTSLKNAGELGRLEIEISQL